MNFETKYLIRWGIPGWVFLFFLFSTIVVGKDLSVVTMLKTGGTKSVGLVIALAGIGVPIGYMFHQVNFGIHWFGKQNLSKNIGYISNLLIDVDESKDITGENVEDYYLIEYLMHNELSKLDEPRLNYLSERYRHLLSTTHSLGALRQSLFAASIFPLVFFFNTWHFEILLITIVCLGMFWKIGQNYNYYSKKTMYFQGRLIKDLLKK
ncbi:hypothetical protein ABE65_011505 [Fictibacillus phosphorivorans]|uniref:Uncharacterized protein n=1 Tax=Fictibacillus phosphorivorans TaxID=1221500 RepID=A0A160IMA1_9BACL|nr:hypothetical protein [Fictibacillus phosphorivorans]ANC77393.1 hypothetical protein ABE65_011505 [Fictibacillus phosphorivorans]